MCYYYHYQVTRLPPRAEIVIMALNKIDALKLAKEWCEGNKIDTESLALISRKRALIPSVAYGWDVALIKKKIR